MQPAVRVRCETHLHLVLLLLEGEEAEHDGSDEHPEEADQQKVLSLLTHDRPRERISPFHGRVCSCCAGRRALPPCARAPRASRDKLTAGGYSACCEAVLVTPASIDDTGSTAILSPLCMHRRGAARALVSLHKQRRRTTPGAPAHAALRPSSCPSTAAVLMRCPPAAAARAVALPRPRACHPSASLPPTPVGCRPLVWSPHTSQAPVRLNRSELQMRGNPRTVLEGGIHETVVKVIMHTVSHCCGRTGDKRRSFHS